MSRSFRVFALPTLSAVLIFLLSFGLSFQWALAAPSFGAVGTAASGSTSLSIPYPSGVAAGNLLVMAIANKHPTAAPSVPSGWTVVVDGQGRGGKGSSGADAGEVYATVFVRVADGTETGNVSVTITSGDCAVGSILRYAKSASESWEYGASAGNDNISGNNWSATAAANPGITSGDMVVAVTAYNSDTPTGSSPSMSATSVTLGSHTERVDTNTSTGNDCSLYISDHTASSGTASAAPVHTFTISSAVNNTNSETGSTVFLRIRDTSVSGAGITITDDVLITASTSVAGTIAKGAGSFVIDHPLDPINKLLYHFFVESPDVKNIYDGIMQLNGNGEATIELPSYFLALNKDFRYLATPVGSPMPNLHLTKEVRKRWFGLFGDPVIKIVGGEPNGRVSWQVTGTRQDPFILANPIVTEVEKGPNQIVDMGEYLHPELYE